MGAHVRRLLGRAVESEAVLDGWGWWWLREMGSGRRRRSAAGTGTDGEGRRRLLGEDRLGRPLSALLLPLVAAFAVPLPDLGPVGEFPGVTVAPEAGLAIFLQDGAAMPALAAANDDEIVDVVFGRVLPEPELVLSVEDLGFDGGEGRLQALLHHDHGPLAVVEPVGRGILAVEQEIADLVLDHAWKLAHAGVDVGFVGARFAAD